MHPRPGFMALVTWVKFLGDKFKGTIPLRRLPMSPHLWPGTESRNQLQYALLLHELYEPRHWACSFEAMPSVLFVASNSCLGVGMCVHVCQYTHTPNMYNNLASIYTCISIRTYTHTHTYAHTRTRTYTRSHTLSHTENPTLAHYFKYLCFNWCGSTLIINGLVCIQKEPLSHTNKSHPIKSHTIISYTVISHAIISHTDACRHSAVWNY